MAVADEERLWGEVDARLAGWVCWEVGHPCCYWDVEAVLREIWRDAMVAGDLPLARAARAALRAWRAEGQSEGGES